MAIADTRRPMFRPSKDQRLSRLAEQVAEIRELDFNPVFALEPGQGAAIVDARIYVGQM